MSGSRRPTYYWDACVYLAWLKQEQNKAGFLPSIRTLIDRNEKGEVNIVTSAITLMEVLESKMSPEKERQFQEFFAGGLHEMRDVDVPVARKARQFRDYFIDRQKPKPSIPDVIHVATASIYRVDFFHTFDDGKNPPLGDDKFSLLGHSGHEGFEGLTIEKPFIDAELGLVIPDLPK